MHPPRPNPSPFLILILTLTLISTLSLVLVVQLQLPNSNSRPNRTQVCSHCGLKLRIRTLDDEASWQLGRPQILTLTLTVSLCFFIPLSL